MNILITGVAGLLGSNFAHWIIKNRSDVNIIGIDDLSGGYEDNLPYSNIGLQTEVINKRFVFHEYDITDQHVDLDFIFKSYKFDYVYHFAAYAAEGLSPFIRQYNYMNNLLATTRLINMSIKYGVKRFVFTSSMAVYGDNVAPFSEDMIRNPIDPYGIAKAACERDLEVANMQHGLDYCIIRPHNVYGIRQNIWDKYRNVLGIWMYKKLHNKPFSIYGDGSQVRAFTYIDDIVEPLWNAAVLPEASKQIINLGGTKDYSIIDAALILRDVVGGASIEHLEGRHEVHKAWATWDKSVDILGYEHKVSLEDGLTEMWNWAKLQPERDQFKWPKYELEKGIYEYWK